jgi:dTDP-4-dehydrorhamnose reductase
MRIVLLGADGQVGWELRRALQPLGELTALTRRTPGGVGDLGHPDRVAAHLQDLRPDWVVNAAAYTAVDRAESDGEAAETINARAVAAIAGACALLGAGLVHYSTDYVFDGSGHAPHREDEPVAPLSVYGQTKADGEAAIRAAGCTHLILRTSWVYAARGSNFARTMLKLARERERLSVVDDQIGAPTGAELLADAAAHALRAVDAQPALAGTYHLAARGETSWYDYAAHVIERARAAGEVLALPVGALARIPTRDYPTPARRPLNSRLDIHRFEAAFDLQLPHWTVGVDRVLDEWLNR